MKTKERILKKALELFNLHGVEAVTTRQIAVALGMSQGNLCYHFAKKEHIVQALYEQLVAIFDTLILDSIGNVPSIQMMIELTKKINAQFLAYKFLMLNFVQIMRQHPAILQHFQQLTAQRNQQFLFLIKIFEQQGIVESEEYEGQYLHILEQLTILNNFWISHAEILYQGKKETVLQHYTDLTIAYFYPYLTERGKADYQRFMQKR